MIRVTDGRVAMTVSLRRRGGMDSGAQIGGLALHYNVES